MASKRVSSLLGRLSSYRDFFYGSRYVLFAVASWTPAIIFFNEHVGEIGIINGPSMSPYLNTGYNESLSKDITWINKWDPTRNLQRGMIVAFRYLSLLQPHPYILHSAD
jgi:inner membrane protease subunit 2